MKTCAKCGLENPSSALHCMGCGALLVEKEKLTEEQKLQNINKELEKENELLKAALEASLKGATSSTDNLISIDEDSLSDDVLPSDDDDLDTDDVNPQSDEDAPQSISDDISEETLEKEKQTNKRLLIITICLLLLVGIVGGLIYWFEIYLPAKKDAKAPRYYVYASALNIRNTPFFDGNANIAGEVSYGAELIVYDSVPGEYYRCKYSPHDVDGKVIKDQVVEGYVHYDYVLPKNDFFLLNSIFGNEDAKEILSETRYKKALLEFFKRNHFIGNLTESMVYNYDLPADMLSNTNGRYQVFCRNKKATSNNVYRSRKYKKDSKYTDAAIILDNLDDRNGRILLYYVFDDDETPTLLVSYFIQKKGYMKDGSLKLCKSAGNYWVDVQFVE